MGTRYRYQYMEAGRGLTRSSSRSVYCQVLLGLFVGMLLGFCLKFDSENDVSEKILPVIRDHNTTNGDPMFFLRCLIIMDKFTRKTESFIKGIATGYAEKCNQTVYFTADRQAAGSIHDQRVVYMESMLTYFHWPVFQSVLERASVMPAQWTMVGNEQVYVVVDNLRKTLSTLDASKPVVVGKVVESTSVLSRMFPSIGWRRLSLSAGVVLSTPAVQLLLNSCSSFWLPRSTERTLFYCAGELDIQVIDPVDEEGNHLFHSKNVMDLISNSEKRRSISGGDAMPGCCSEHACTFGEMSYKDQAVVHYAVEHLQVFGQTGFEKYKPTTSTSTTKATTKKRVAKASNGTTTPATPPNKKSKKEENRKKKGAKTMEHEDREEIERGKFEEKKKDPELEKIVGRSDR